MATKTAKTRMTRVPTVGTDLEVPAAGMALEVVDGHRDLSPGHLVWRALTIPIDSMRVFGNSMVTITGIRRHLPANTDVDVGVTVRVNVRRDNEDVESASE